MAPRRLLLCALALVVALFGVAPAGGDDLDENQQKQQQNKAAQDEARKTDEELAAAVDNANRKVSAQQAVLDAAQQRVADANQKIAATEKRIEETRGLIAERNHEVETRAVYAYKNPDGRGLDAVLGAEDVNQAVNRAEMLQKLFAADRAILDRLKVLRADLEDLKRQLDRAKADAERAKADADVELSRLTTARDAATAAKAAVDRRIADLEAEAKALAEEEVRIKDTIRQAELARVAEMSGINLGGNLSAAGFINPTAGVITSGFGLRWGRLHAGVDIANDTGTPIVAAARGVVIAAEWYGGYGNAVLIDHGGGLVTLYGHMSAFKVSGGETVNQGQLIGLMGSTGNSTGPHCHFEVRVGGEPINPVPFLP